MSLRQTTRVNANNTSAYSPKTIAAPEAVPFCSEKWDCPRRTRTKQAATLLSHGFISPVRPRKPSGGNCHNFSSSCKARKNIYLSTTCVLFQRFIADMEIISLDEEVNRLAIDIRRVHRFRLPDASVAASAAVHDALLFANDQRLAGIPNPRVRALSLRQHPEN